MNMLVKGMSVLALVLTMGTLQADEQTGQNEWVPRTLSAADGALASDEDACAQRSEALEGIVVAQFTCAEEQFACGGRCCFKERQKCCTVSGSSYCVLVEDSCTGN